MEWKLTEDLSKLSNVDSEILTKLFEGMCLCIEQELHTDFLNNESETIIDLEFAKIAFFNRDGQLKIKFIPSEHLLSNIKLIERGKEPRLKKRLEKTILKKIADLMKEF